MKTDKKKKFRALLALALAMVLVLGHLGMAPAVKADEDEEEEHRASSDIKKDLVALQEQQSQIQSEIDGIEGQISDNMTDMEAVMAQKTLIEQEVFLLYEQVTNINAQIAAYSALIADKQEELDQAQQALSELQARNKERLRAMEKNSGTSYWAVIFKATNFLDMLDRVKMIQEIAESDRIMIAQLREATQTVAAAKTSLEGEKTQLEQTKAQLDATQITLDAKRAEAEGLLQELVSKGQAYEILVEQAEEKKADLGEQIDQVQQEYDEAVEYEEYQAWLEEQRRLEAERKAREEALKQQQLLQQQQQQQSGGTAGTAHTITTEEGKQLTWLVPITYTRFSSPFGYRIHPVYGDYRFHYGVDLSAPSGTPIYATRSGTVSVATYDWSAGYYVNINHGDGFVSRYLHMTHFIVSPGQTVTAGQIIGYCGSTGTSTGPHLHFGIYHNGTAVNPADYIAI